MKSKYSLLFLMSLFLIIITTNCKEEAIVEQNNNTVVNSNKTLAKENIVLTQVADSIIRKEQKDKITRLKKEHEKPYVVLEKPEKILSEKLKSRTINKSISKSSNKYGSYSAQSSQSCYTIEIEIWAFEKYHSITGFNTGICPKSDWMNTSSILVTLKNTWSFNLIMLGTYAVANQIVYPHNQIVAGVDPMHPYWSKMDYMNFQPRDLYGFYMDEPAHSLDPAMRDSVSKVVSNLKELNFTSSLYWTSETCDILADNVDDLVDVISMSGYTDYSYNILFGCNNYLASSDQRNEWTDYNNLFGSKFNHLWISGELDRGEMD